MKGEPILFACCSIVQTTSGQQYGGSKLNTKKLNYIADVTFITDTVNIRINTAISGKNNYFSMILDYFCLTKILNLAQNRLFHGKKQIFWQ